MPEDSSGIITFTSEKKKECEQGGNELKFLEALILSHTPTPWLTFMKELNEKY
jgi:hypothetical protein